MKYYNIRTLFACLLLFVFASCQDDLPGNATIVSPISSLEMTVKGIDYIVQPRLQVDKTLNDTLFLSVRIPASEATVKTIQLSDGLTTDVKQGDVVTFVEDVFPITLSKGAEKQTYFVKMDYSKPAILYFVKSSDKDEEGNGSYLDLPNAQRIASLNSDDKYEGFIDLTTSDWDNICLVASDFKAMYEFEGGWWSERSSGSFTLVEKKVSGSGNYFRSVGPWADWKWSNDNPLILSPGVWKFDFNIASGELNLVETQWAISGTAIDSQTAMTYDPETRLWTVAAPLSAGNIKFTTIPVTEGDSTLSYGELGSTAVTGYLESQGRDIEIETAGNYKIVLDFSNPPFYSYSITKN